MSSDVCLCGHKKNIHDARGICLGAMCPCMQFHERDNVIPPQGGTGVVRASVNETTPIKEHEGRKYLKKIWPAAKMVGDGTIPDGPILVDVYCVIEAFKVTCPARQQALKKLLMAGDRGKGDAIADLIGAQAAINRAIELARQREREATND